MVAEHGGRSHRLAPVIPLFDDRSGAVPGATAPEPAWRSTWDGEDDYDDFFEDGGYEDDGYDACGAIERELAETALLKRLRTRQLSIAEARAVVAERDLSSGDVEGVLDAFGRRGYLDDARLAEQLIHTATDRRGQGRRAIAQTLLRRGIPREVADAALAALPDDDAERALEFARGKARSMANLDRQTAERRLVGQLARRGYGSVALSVARQALDEQAGGRVRFE
ncbi:regulatory protein RecX [Microbacterium sp.]|uniref:regulatory protein RecX n=1 Tax=Microbacterium sp. TaxID=51671 RepID=UPI0039E230B5